MALLDMTEEAVPDLVLGLVDPAWFPEGQGRVQVPFPSP